MRYFIGFLFALFFCFVVWGGLIYFQSGNASKMSQWVYDVYEKKSLYAKGISGKKIVVVAGSNALFGVNSKMLEDAFGMNVVNYGVNAGIELPLTLQLARDVIGEGDIVILPLEYPMYSYDGDMGVQMIDFLISRKSEYFWDLSLKEMFNIIWKIELRRVLQGYFDKSIGKVEAGLYGYKNINEQGDQIRTQLKYRHEVYFKGIKNEPESYADDFKIDAISWDYIDNFINWCNKKNARVIFTPTTLMKRDEYFNKDKWYYESIGDLVRSKGYLFLGEPLNYMFDKDDYFDTNYHLIDSARDVRTEMMIKDLRDEIKSSLKF